MLACSVWSLTSRVCVCVCVFVCVGGGLVSFGEVSGCFCQVCSCGCECLSVCMCIREST